MNTYTFEHKGRPLFDIHCNNYPLPRIGDIVTLETMHYEVSAVRHRFAWIKGVRSTGIKITLIERRERDILETQKY